MSVCWCLGLLFFSDSNSDVTLLYPSVSDILRLTPTSASSTAAAGAFNSLAGHVPEITPRDQAMAELEATLPDQIYQEHQGDEQNIATSEIHQADVTAAEESMAVLTAADPNQSIVIDTEPLLNDSLVDLGSPTAVLDKEVSAESLNVAESAESSGAELKENSLDVALESQTLDLESANVDVMPDPSLSSEGDVMSTTDVKESPEIGVHDNDGIETTDVMA